MNTFDELGLHPSLTRALTALAFKTPTPIQEKAIPPALDGRDVLGLAQTGTGKTAAFGLPMLNALLESGRAPVGGAARALVLAPTRELAAQIETSLSAFAAQGAALKIGVVVGGAPMNRQIKMLRGGLDVLVATPGRLLDLADRGAVRLGATRFLVLDEADQMLDLGFMPALKKIAAMVGADRQTLLFSATMPKEIAALAARFLADPVRVEVTPPGRTADKIAQSVRFVADAAEKIEALRDALAAEPGALALVFARTKRGADRLAKKLVAAGID
ncbi:MAG: DEAD/DEAH box helicase, partial [Pseudomonadota bacterium]